MQDLNDNAPAKLATSTKSVRRREIILQCATELFDRKGYSNTSLDDVAQAIGLKREALYYYYRNRSELLLAIIKPQTTGLMDGLRQIIEQPIPAGEKLHLAIRNHLARFDLHCLEMTITLRDGVMGANDPVREEMTRIWKKYERMWTAFISEGQASGELAAIGDPKMIAFAILGMCNWLARWYSPDKKISIDEIIDTYFKLTSLGLVPVSRRAPVKKSRAPRAK